MAGRIQGITVEIGGDTTKLQTALKGVNTEIRNTQSQLRDVDKLLKLDPGNTELLAQKHRLLGDAVKETKEKLETLKTAAEQAEQALKDGTITQDQYDGLQREIVETEQKLKSLEEQAKASGTALQEIAAKGEKLKTVGDNVTNVGKKFMPVTLGVVGLGMAAVKTAADFDSAMSKVAAVSGATGSDLEALRDKAREMGEKTKFSASEAAEAMNYMAMAGWKTEDMLSGIEGVMNLAAASGEDLATTSDIVTDALTAFGLTAKDSGHFADILAAASSNANTNVSMMGETFKYCAPIAGALGFSAEDTAEAIGLMANAGIKGSQAGTALRTIMNNLSGEVKMPEDIEGATSSNYTIPMNLNAGVTYYYCLVDAVSREGGKTGVAESDVATVTVNKAAPTVTAPTAKTLTYNGSAQELVNAGFTKDGTIQYAIGTKDAATESYKADIPKGTEVGTYYVWYKVVGDANHTDSAAKCVTVTISKKEESSSTTTETTTTTNTTTPITTPAPKTAVPTSQQEKITVSKAPKIKKLRSKKNKVQVTWNKIRKNKAGKKLIKQIKYIEIQAARDPEFQNIVATKNVGKKKSKTVLKLGRKTTYFVRVRYVGANGVSKWSKVKKVKTK